VDKTPIYSLNLQTLERAEDDFEAARYIHLIRHPSPMIASFEEAKLHVFFPPFFTRPHNFTIWQLAELIWVVSHQNICQFLRTIPTKRKLVVRFEELVRHPKKTMKKVANFLELPLHPNMINPYRQDRRAQMTDAIHPLARMLGDIKFHQHGKIRAEAADRHQGRYPEESLGEVTRQLAHTLGYDLRNRQGTTLVSLESRGRAPAFFCVHPASGVVSCYQDLARHLGPNQPLYAFRAPALNGEASHDRSVEQLASSYLQQLRVVQPRGPYQLGGWSFGGLVAFEIALQLTASGEEVALLALFSSYLPQSGIALPPLRIHDFVLGFLHEHGLDVLQTEVGGPNRRGLLKYMFTQAQQVGVISRDLSSHDFRRVIVPYWQIYRAHVQMGRRYIPQARAGRVILFETKDRSLDGHGQFLDWNTVSTHVFRHTIPGNHFTMLREPNVRQVAECLREDLLPDSSEPPDT
jgi:thioesterase domain-containing protein